MYKLTMCITDTQFELYSWHIFLVPCKHAYMLWTNDNLSFETHAKVWIEENEFEFLSQNLCLWGTNWDDLPSRIQPQTRKGKEIKIKISTHFPYILLYIYIYTHT